MEFNRKVTLLVTVDAPTEFDVNEILADNFGSAEDFGIVVHQINVAGVRKPK